MAEPSYHKLKDRLVKVDPKDPSTWLYRVECEGFSRDFPFSMQDQLESKLGQLKDFLVSRDRKATPKQVNDILDKV